jgi:hypothetical protein
VTPERVAKVVVDWARLYTRGLPAPVAQRRIDEIAADLHDETAHGRARGNGERRIAVGIASRAVRGVPADLVWRTRHTPALGRSLLRVAAGVTLILALPFVGMFFTDEVVWSLADFILAGVLLATVGFVFELAVRRVGNRGTAIVVGALGIAAAVLGETDDAPGLVLLGLLLVGSACALGIRTAQRRR